MVGKFIGGVIPGSRTSPLTLHSLATTLWKASVTVMWARFELGKGSLTKTDPRTTSLAPFNTCFHPSGYTLMPFEGCFDRC